MTRSKFLVYFFVKITFFMIFEKKKITLENPLIKPFLKIETTLKKKKRCKVPKSVDNRLQKLYTDNI